VRLDVCCAQEERNEKPAVATTLIYGIYFLYGSSMGFTDNLLVYEQEMGCISKKKWWMVVNPYHGGMNSHPHI